MRITREITTRRIPLVLCLLVMACGPATATPPLPGGLVPGPEAQLWAPGVINTELITRDVAMTPDMTEIYFSVATPGYAQAVICVTRWDGSAWSEPEVAPFSGSAEWMDLEPFISPDGQRFFFLSTRPKQGEEPGQQDIWVMDRKGSGWGEPSNLGAPVNSGDPEFFPAVARDGTLYFTRADSTGVHRIMRSRRDGDRYTQPELLPEQVNCGRNRFNATVDPDQTRVILSAVGVPGFPGVRYYQIRRNGDDTWQEPEPLAEAVNGEVGRGWSPYLSPDGKTFFFMSGRRLGEQPGWPAAWSALQGQARRPASGAGNIWVIEAGVLEAADPENGGQDGATAAAEATFAPADSEPVAWPAPRGDYLGCTPPGSKPEIFAPGLVSTALNERDILFTGDGRQAWFGLMDAGLVTIMTTRLVDGAWTEPVTAPFHLDKEFACFEPTLAADGRTMLFLSNRAAPGQEQGRGWANQNIFRSRLGPGGWSEPEALPPPVTTAQAEYFPSLARDGTLYFTRSDSTDTGWIWAAEPEGDGFAEPVRLPAAVNGAHGAFNATIHPDEEWLIMCVPGHPDNLGPIDYWICFADGRGGWLPARNLGPDFNGPGRRAASVSLSPDGRSLFFSSTGSGARGTGVKNRLKMSDLRRSLSGADGGGSDIFWVEASVLDNVR